MFESVDVFVQICDWVQMMSLNGVNDL